jgi:hypothetical protein
MSRVRHLGVARINSHLQFVAPATNIKRAVVLIRGARSQTGGDARQNPERQPALPRFCPISTSLRPTYRQISPSDDNVKIADNKTSDSAKPPIGSETLPRRSHWRPVRQANEAPRWTAFNTQPCNKFGLASIQGMRYG